MMGPVGDRELGEGAIRRSDEISCQAEERELRGRIEGEGREGVRKRCERRRGGERSNRGRCEGEGEEKERRESRGVQVEAIRQVEVDALELGLSVDEHGRNLLQGGQAGDQPHGIGDVGREDAALGLGRGGIWNPGKGRRVIGVREEGD